MSTQLSKKLGILVAALFCALWAYPLYRAASFFSWAQSYYGETHSINAANDLNYATSLAVSYSISILGFLSLAYLVFRFPRPILLLPLGLAAFAVIEVLRLRPESPIPLFPNMMPWRPALLNTAAAALAAACIFAPRLIRRPT